jgi:hypothetical protein
MIWFFHRTNYYPLVDQDSKLLKQDNGSSNSVKQRSNPSFYDDWLPRRYWKFALWLTVFNVICILSSVSAISLGLSDQVAGRNALLEHTSFYCKCKWLQDPASESSYWLPARSPRRQESFVVVVSISLELSSSGQWQSCRVRDKCRTKSTALQRKVSHDTILQRKAKKHKIGMLQVHWNCTDSDRRMASSTQKYHGSILLIFCWTLASARRSGGIVTDHLLSIKEFQQAIASPMCSNEDGSDP